MRTSWRWKKCIPGKNNKKKSGVVILTPNKVDFKGRHFPEIKSNVLYWYIKSTERRNSK